MVPEEVFRLMSLGSTDGVVCPGLRKLHWKADPHTLPFHRLLLSSKLTALSLTYASSRSPEKDISILQPVITGLDTFHLRDLHLQWCIHEEASRKMESAASSAVLRCGPALEKLVIFSPLSDAAIQHIMQLPNLITLCAVNGPPRAPTLSLSDIFPRLDYLSLAEEVSLEWLTFFTTTARRISSGHSSRPPPNRGPVQRLGALFTFPEVPVDIVFMSPIMLFHGLIYLRLTSACSTMGECAFNLTDDNVAEIAAALPHLGDAVFGTICSANSCQTTVASLVSFSARCRHLELLEIHFNTENLRNDLESVLADPRLDSLPSLRTCDIFRLCLSGAPYTLGGDDIVPVLKGFRRIFPSLTEISGRSASWEELNRRLPEA